MGGKERKGRFTARMMVNFWTAYCAELPLSMFPALSHVAPIEDGSIGFSLWRWYRPLCRTGVASCVAMV